MTFLVGGRPVCAYSIHDGTRKTAAIAQDGQHRSRVGVAAADSATPHSRVASGGHFSCWCVCARLAAVAAAWKGHAIHLLR